MLHPISCKALMPGTGVGAFLLIQSQFKGSFGKSRPANPAKKAAPKKDAVPKKEEAPKKDAK